MANNNYNKQLSSLSSITNNLKMSINSLYGKINNSRYIDTDSIESKELFRPTIEQYSTLIEMCRDKKKYYNFQSVIDLFELTDDEVLELLRVNSDDRQRDMEFRRANSHRVKDIHKLPELVELLKLDAMQEILSISPGSIAEVCSMLLHIHFKSGTIFPFEYIRKTCEYLIAEFEPIVHYHYMEVLAHSADNEDTEVESVRPAEASEEDVIRDFKYNVLNSMLGIVYNSPVAPDADFIMDNAELIEVSFLMDFYKTHQDDMKITKMIKETLQRRCMHTIRRQFGPCASLIKIKIEWDLDSMILFNDVSEDDSEMDRCEDEY